MLDHHSGRAGRSASSGLAQRCLAKARDHRAAGRSERARASLSRVLGAEPNHPDAHYELGQLLAASAPEKAVTHFVTALRGAPEKPAHWIALASALLAAERLADARAILERYKAQHFGPEARPLTEAFIDHTLVAAQGRYDLRKWEDAEALLDLIILLDEQHSHATYLAGAVAARTNRLELAFDLMSIALLREPRNPLFFTGLSTILIHRGDHDGAISALEKALEINDDLALAHANISGVYQHRFRFSDALRHAERAIALDPGNAGAYSNRGSAFLGLGRLGQAVEAFDQALALDPSKLFVASNCLFAKLYSADITPEDYTADARAFGRRFADPLLRRRPFTHDRDPERRLRVGVVSADFREHAVNYFFEPALRSLDRAELELVAFSNNPYDDLVTVRLRSLFDAWHDIASLDDDEAADLIEAEAIDILIDLSGHTAGNRLFVFARKPAPIQVGWIGYPGTTGMQAMDYRFTDIHADPVGMSDDLSVETLWRLPRVGACYQAPVMDLPLAAHPPSQDNGYVTFGCVNRFAKVSDEALEAWGCILDRVPGSKLLLEIADLQDPGARKRVEERLSSKKVPLDRVVLEARTSENRYVLYNRMDLALDPFPYNGGTTSLDSLWMGVPFIALEGRHYVARIGHSILTNAGLSELSAPTIDAYVDLASRVALDAKWLRDLRHDLRSRFAASAHMNNELFARDVGVAFRQMWQTWLAKSAA